MASKFGTNLARASYWNAGIHFLDQMKSSGDWYYVSPAIAAGRAQPVTDLTPDGWPNSIPAGSNTIAVSVPVYVGTWEYIYEWTGSGTMYLKGETVIDSKPGYKHVSLTAPVTPTTGPYVDLVVSGMTPDNPIRSITVVRADPDFYDLFKSGEIFNPDFVANLKGFDTIRFMDWMGTNNSTFTTAYPAVTSRSWMVTPIEIIVQLANKVGARPWVNIPHQATDDLVKTLLTALKASKRTPIVEYSNETWNFGFLQSKWLTALASTLWATATTEAPTDGWLRAYGYKVGQLAIINRAYGYDIAIGTQTSAAPVRAASVWAGVALTGATDADFKYWIATAYLSGGLDNANNPDGLALMAKNDIASTIAYIDKGISAATGELSYYAQNGAIAAAHGLQFAIYEANLDLRGSAYSGDNQAKMIAFFAAVTRDPGTYALHKKSVDTFNALNGALFCAFTLCSYFSKDGTYSLMDDWKGPYVPFWKYLQDQLAVAAKSNVRAAILASIDSLAAQLDSLRDQVNGLD